jgi:hypothetical protein
MYVDTVPTGAPHCVSVAPERVKLQSKEARDSPSVPLYTHQACWCADALFLPSRAPPQRCVAAQTGQAGAEQSQRRRFGHELFLTGEAYLLQHVR